jgi:L-rhamnose mutarotase
MGKMEVKRFGQVIKDKPEKLDDYLELHANPWPCVLEMIKQCNIRNYSIYLLDNHTLFAYYEYTGQDYEADMAKLAADPCTQSWWKETDPCHEQLHPGSSDWWLDLPEIFHTD